MRYWTWTISALVAFLLAACGGAASSGSVSASTPSVEEVSSDPKSSAADAGTFTPTGGMAFARTNQQALLLPDGRVLSVGGRGKDDSHWGPERHDSAEIYDPATGEWTETGSMTKKRQAHTADLLSDGRVLVTGGQSTQDYHKSTDIWDPATGKWDRGPRMKTARWTHASVELADGRIMVMGGNDDLFALVAKAEILDPVGDEWAPTGSLAQPRAEHTATLLKDGRVLVVGGGKGGLGQEENTFDTAEIWAPSSSEWSAAASLSVGRANHTATLLSDGRVLVAGSRGKIITAEIYDPTTDTWSPAGAMSQWRALHTATLLPDGRVLITGGIGIVTSSDLYDPSTGAWSPGPDMTIPRYAHAATLLSDGRVMLAGGNTTTLNDDRTLANSAEIFEP